MSALLTPPTALLVVGAEDATEDVRTAADGVVEDVPTASDLDGAAETLRARGDVGCALVRDLGGAGVREACERLREPPDIDGLPVLLHLAEPPADTLTEAAAVPDCRYLPRSAGPSAVGSALDDALRTFERRRDRIADAQLFRTLIADSGDAVSVFAKDDRGRYVRTGPLAEWIDREEILGRTDRDVFGRRYPGAAERAYRDDLDVVRSGEPIHGQREQFGDDFWSEATKLPWRDGSGRIRGLAGLAVEVTDTVRAERELEARRRRFEEFASYVSHDVRSPLQAGYWAVELAREGETGALDRVETAFERIEAVVDDMRALAEEDVGPEDEGSSDEAEGIPSTRLDELVREVWAGEGVATPSATLVVDLPPGTTVVERAELLRPPIENLLKNAVDHGGPDVTVRVGALDRGFYVADDGPGIPPGERERVLEPGYTTADDGSGTGLTIVREAVSERGWGLSVDGSDAGGARFDVTDVPVILPVSAETGAAHELDTTGDVGDVAVAGSAERVREGLWRVRGAGRDLWSDIDEFQFVSTAVDGPVRITARVDDFERANEYTKAGVTVRNGREPGQACAFVGRTADHGTEVLRRTDDGRLATSYPFEEPGGRYRYYRIDRVGDTVTCSVSADGDQWLPVDQRRIRLRDPAAVGLAVCSHDPDRTVETIFTDVSVRTLTDATVGGES